MRSTLFINVCAYVSTLIVVTHAATFHNPLQSVSPRRLSHAKFAAKKRSWGDLDSYGSSNACPVTGTVNRQALLNMHNTMRATVGAKPLSWGEDLAAVAQCHANKCRFEHSHTRGMGENIACGNGNQYQPELGVKEWWDEWKLWRQGMGFAESTGHFTQMAWKDTKRVGCGVATCSSQKLGLGSGGYYPKGAFLVCEYDPPGNVIGRFNGEVNLPYNKNADLDSYGGNNNNNNDKDSYGGSPSTSNFDDDDDDDNDDDDKDVYGGGWNTFSSPKHSSHHGHQPSSNYDVTTKKVKMPVKTSKKPHSKNK